MWYCKHFAQPYSKYYIAKLITGKNYFRIFETERTNILFAFIMVYIIM